MTPEMLQTYSIPIGIGLAIVIMIAVGPLRNAVTASFEQGRKSGENARRALGGSVASPAPAQKPSRPAAQTAPRSFGRRGG
jgi:hypothetical protein